MFTDRQTDGQSRSRLQPVKMAAQSVIAVHIY